ncbi:NAD-dependent deacetylase hst3 [Madurella fahalii]|uniref:NAD-dependent deacetylase hst3 n=1 Tax=Madurella fahalii TaxID=1157608 RepID=A0ABQ0G2I9_9PEZI
MLRPSTLRCHTRIPGSRPHSDLRSDAQNMGTSLATDGVKLLVKDLAKIIHKLAGKVVYVNLAKPPKSWNGVVDYWVKWDCDAWVRDLMRHQPALCSGNREGRRARDHVLTIREPYLEEAGSIPRVLIDLTREVKVAAPRGHDMGGDSREIRLILPLVR